MLLTTIRKILLLVSAFSLAIIFTIGAIGFGMVLIMTVAAILRGF